MNIELITWNDAWEDKDTVSITPKRLSKLASPMVTETVGFVLADTDQGVLLTSERWPTSPNEAKYVTFIPRGMIVTRHVLVKSL